MAYVPNILVVDDEPAIRRTLKEILEFEKFKVDEASNGLECMVKLKKDSLEVILMDCNGFEIESDTYCYELGERDCPNLLMVNQSDFNAISNAVFRASSVVISASKVKGNRNVTLSAMDWHVSGVLIG